MRNKSTLASIILIVFYILIFHTGTKPTEDESVPIIVYKDTPTIELNDMRGLNLHGYDEFLNKKNIDLYLEATPLYKRDCIVSDFVLKSRYAEYKRTDAKIYEYDDYIKIDGYYKKNNSEKNYDAFISIYFCKSRNECHEKMRQIARGYAAPAIYPSLLSIGDFAIGGIYDIEFIRGNVLVTARRSYYNDIVIEDLAMEIDQQILDLLI